jgi:ATP-binding cassette subfamily B (MDR/TAP) protein 1
MAILKKKDKQSSKKERQNTMEEVVMLDPHEPIVRFGIFKLCYLIGWDIIWIIIGLAGYACWGALPVVFNVLMGELIEAGTASEATKKSKIHDLSIWMAIIAAISCVVTYIGTGFMHFAFERVGVRLKSAYIDAVMKQEVAYFDIKRTGQIIAYMTESLEQIQDCFTNKLGAVLKSLVQIILGVTLALVFAWKMALVLLSFAPVVLFMMFFAGLASQLVMKRTIRISTAASAVANEVIGAIRTVRSMDGEDKEIQRFQNKLATGNKLFVLKGIILGTPIGAMELSIWGILSFGMWWGGRLLINGEISLGNMIRVFTLLLFSVIQCSMLMSYLPDFGRAYQASLNILKVIYRKPVMRYSGGITPNKIEGHVEFKNVSFAYPTRPNLQVLKNFNLTITPGQAVALVGASGSGKSTIVGLIERFYEANSGEIYLDGVNIAEIDPRWIHRNIGIVTQEPTLFAGTIRDNIIYAVSEYRQPTEEEVIQAAIAANAHDFITALPDGYNTTLGERGTALSGGQKQRVAIARAMIQNPSLLLLDEATSALDTASESLVQDALNKLMKGRTSIVIAHRLSTIIDSDVICVMNKGELKEKGTHSELIKINDGYYTKLAQKQMMMSQINEDEVSEISDQEEQVILEKETDNNVE